jgi:hypothetical protein
MKINNDSIHHGSLLHFIRLCHPAGQESTDSEYTPQTLDDTDATSLTTTEFTSTSNSLTSLSTSSSMQSFRSATTASSDAPPLHH